MMLKVRSDIISRNNNGQGSYYHDKVRKRYCWQLRWKDLQGNEHKKTLTAKTRKLLVPKVEEFLKSFNDCKNSNSNFTVEEWLEKWLISIRDTVKPKTFEYYSYLTYGYIVPKFGEMIIGDIKPIDIQEFINNLKRLDGQNKELSRSTKNGIRATLRAAFTAAYNNGYINYNPVKATRPVKGVVKKRKAFTKEQMETILSTAENVDYVHTEGQQRWTENDAQIYLRKSAFYLIRLAADTGMRIGELLALSWADINFERGFVIVNKTLIKSDTGDTKTEKERIVSLSKSAVAKLREWENIQKQHADKYAGIYSNDRNIIFADSCGNYRNVRNFRVRYWKKICAAANLEEFDIHCIRHYHATELIRSGAPIGAVSKRLGHATVAITMNIYAHVIAEMENKLDGVLEKLND